MRNIFWIFGGAVFLGVALGTGLSGNFLSGLIFLTLAVVLLLLQRLGFQALALLLGAALIFLGSYWYGQRALHFYEALSATQEVSSLFRVTEVTEEASFYEKIILREVDCQEHCLSTKILWQGPLNEEPVPGALYTLQCALSVPENFAEDFDYRRYLAKEGVGYICKEESNFSREKGDTISRVYSLVYAPRFWLEGLLAKLYPYPESALAAGLLLGGSNRLPENIADQFQRLGLTHIVAVSGYNIVLIVNAFLLLGIGVGLYRKPAIIVALLGITLFIVFIGTPASAVRAGIMAGAALGAFFIARPTYSLRGLFATASFMVLWNPLIFWYDAGFQLSFLATLGVLFGLRFSSGHFSEQSLIRFYQETAWLSFFVYIFLLPLLVYQFGRVTPFSVFANVLFLPLVPIAMLFSFVGSIIIFLFPPLALLVGWPGYIALTLILRGTEFLSAVPGANLSFHLPLTLVLLWYGLICSVLMLYERRCIQRKYQKGFTCPHSH